MGRRSARVSGLVPSAGISLEGTEDIFGAVGSVASFKVKAGVAVAVLALCITVWNLPSAHDSGSSLDKSRLAADTLGMTLIPDFEPLSMTRRDPDLNMARFYSIALQPTLFGEVSIIRNWGRIGTRGQVMLETFPSPLAAERQAILIERQKRRRGYG